ncbi:MAG: hypothetical protein ACXWME_01280 [Syntrophales bacterium]
MDFPHLRKPGDYDYPITVSVFFFHLFDRECKSPPSGTCKTFDESVLPLFRLTGRSVISVPGRQQGKIMLD